MTLIDRARHLLTCDELRGQLPDEVADFLREVAALEPVAGITKHALNNLPIPYWHLFDKNILEASDAALYTLETPHDR